MTPNADAEPRSEGRAKPRLDRCQHGRVALASLYTVHEGEDRFCVGDMATIEALVSDLGPAPRSGVKKERELRSWSGRPSPATLVDCECGLTCDWVGILAEASTEGLVLRCPACVAAGHPPSVREAWLSLCPAFLSPDADFSTLNGSNWVTMLPLALGDYDFGDRFRGFMDGLLPLGVDHGYALARGTTFPRRGEVPAGSMLRLGGFLFDEPPSLDRLFEFRVVDGPMSGTDLSIAEGERDTAWQQGFPEVSRAISMLVPPRSAEAMSWRYAEARSRTVEDVLEVFRRLALDHWEPSKGARLRSLEPAVLSETR